MEAASAGGRQALSIAATSDRMSLGANRVEGLKVNLTLDDLWAARGRLRRRRGWPGPKFAGQSIADVRLTATGGADVSDVDFSGVVRRTGGEGERPAHRRPVDPARTLRPSPQRRRPAARARSSGDPDLWRRWSRHPEFRARRRCGRLSLSGRAGLDARPSSVCGAGAARRRSISFRPGRPVRRRRRRGDHQRNGRRTVWQLAAATDGVSAPQTRTPPCRRSTSTGSGRLAGSRTSLDVAVNVGKGSSVRSTGSAPLAIGRARREIDGKLDAGLANTALSISGRHVVRLPRD